jgi:hypothetical protein
MAEAPQGQGQPAPEGQPQGQPQGQPEVPEGYVPQARVNSIAAKEKGEGRTAAMNELLEKAREVNPDVESVDDVLAAYSEYQGIQEAVTTEADRERTRAEREAAKAKESDGLYVSTLREFALRDALRDAGINSERLPLALKIADMDSLEVDRKTRSVTGVEDVVKAIGDASPEWFGEQVKPRVNAPQTTGTGVQKPAGEVTKESLGQSMLGWLTEPVPNEPTTWP